MILGIESSFSPKYHDYDRIQGLFLPYFFLRKKRRKIAMYLICRFLKHAELYHSTK